MLLSVLNYLSNPFFFAGFSIVVGIAYVLVWVISLRELGREYRTTYRLRGMRAEPEPKRRINNMWKRGDQRRTVRVKVAGNAKTATNGRSRVTRAA